MSISMAEGGRKEGLARAAQRQTDLKEKNCENSFLHQKFDNKLYESIFSIKNFPNFAGEKKKGKKSFVSIG